jgi:hypothetical protein
MAAVIVDLGFATSHHSVGGATLEQQGRELPSAGNR